ncbi:Uncharacterised protein [Collinsella intestinalis]|nr:Uncharacterised protein [Collinsella intestinalis]
MVLEQHLGGAEQARGAVSADIERERVHVGVVSADEFLHEEVTREAGVPQVAPQLVEFGLRGEEIDLFEALEEEVVVPCGNGGLGDDREGNRTRRDGLVSSEVCNFGPRRLEVVRRT